MLNIYLIIIIITYIKTEIESLDKDGAVFLTSYLYGPWSLMNPKTISRAQEPIKSLYFDCFVENVGFWLALQPWNLFKSLSTYPPLRYSCWYAEDRD